MDYKAFVSSTFLDLREHRAHVIAELRKAGFFVDPMEDWTADVDEPKKLSTRRLEGCHLCVLIVARRRGHIPAGDSLSITQQEFEEAKRRGIDVLVYLLDDAVIDWPNKFDDRGTDVVVQQWRQGIEPTPDRFNSDPRSIHIAPALTRWVKEDGPKVALRRYLETVQQEHGAIRFVSLPRLEDLQNAPIHRLYVEPSIAGRWLSPDVNPKEWGRTTSLIDWVSTFPFAVLLGDPGSGKSTLVSWIAWQLAKHHESKNRWTDSLGSLIPIPMILRELGVEAGVTWDSLLAAFLKQSMGKLLTLTNLQRLLDDGRVLIMLDGLDEIGDPAARRDLKAVFEEARLKYRNCRWLLTSRVVGYQEVPFHMSVRPSTAHPHRTAAVQIAELGFVAPFDDSQVDQFSHNWNVLRESSEERAQNAAHDLLSAVRGDEATSKLGRIPNLLTMMALIYRIRARLPHGRALLYNEIAQAYLETIDSFRRIYGRSETLAEKKRWLARVGFEIQRQRMSGNSLEKTRRKQAKEIFATGDDIRRWISAVMSESGKEESDADASVVLDHLTRRSGLLLPRGADQFAFLHLSFQEYFAACFLQNQIASPNWITDAVEEITPGATKSDLKNAARSLLWRETLVFLYELLASEQPQWLKPLNHCIFGDKFGDIASANNVSRNQAVLLARIVVDPHSGIVSSARDAAIDACCDWELQAQIRSLSPSEVLQTLLATEGNDRRHILEQLVRATERSNQGALTLEGTPTKDLSPLSKATWLKALNLSRTQVTDLGPLSSLIELKHLNLGRTPVTSIKPLESLAQLQVLNLKQTAVTDWTSLAHLRCLKSLKLAQTEIADLHPLSQLANLEALDLRGTKVDALSPLSGMCALKILNLKCARVRDLTPLSQLRRLESLRIEGKRVFDIRPLRPLTELKRLTLRGSKVADFEPIGSLIGLEYVSLRDSTISDLSPLRALTALVELNLKGTRVRDLSPLVGLTNLKQIWLGKKIQKDILIPKELEKAIRRI